MTARQYLQQLRRIMLNIEILQEEIEIRRAKLESTTIHIQGEKVQTSSSGDKFADMMAALADKGMQLNDMLYAYERMRDIMVRQILGLDAPALQVRILYDRYFKGLALVKIAAEVHYGRDYIWQQHLKALDAFAAQYQGEY